MSLRPIDLEPGSGYFLRMLSVALLPAKGPLTLGKRLVSLFEVLLGAVLIIGHNVFHIFPNEVPILFVLFWISFWLRDDGWKVAGFKQPRLWLKTVMMAVIAAVVLQLGSELVIQPLARHLWRSPEQVSSLLKMPAHSWKLALRNLAVIWVFAAFGEEVAYRGYLLTRAADLGNRSKLAYIASMLYVAVLFGFGHFYKGPVGIVDSTYSGLVLGGVYLLSGRNLWTAILAHGISDTFVILVLFMGWAT